MRSLAEDILNCNDDPIIKVVSVSPETARKWLERNIGNRPESSVYVNRYAKDMEAGRWKMTGDPIRFSKTGKLIDGQTRLKAIIQSGATIKCTVISDLADEIFDVLDNGRTRSKSDGLFIEYGLPVETCKILSASVAYMIDYENEQWGFGAKADKHEVNEYVRRNPLSIAAAEYAATLPRKTPPAPRSIAAFFYYHASRRNEHDARRFLDRFCIGTVDGPDDCLLYLRNRCFSAAVDRRPIHRSHVIASLIRIWNAEQRGKPIKYPQNSLRQDGTCPTFI